MATKPTLIIRLFKVMSTYMSICCYVSILVGTLFVRCCFNILEVQKFSEIVLSVELSFQALPAGHLIQDNIFILISGGKKCKVMSLQACTFPPSFFSRPKGMSDFKHICASSLKKKTHFTTTGVVNTCPYYIIILWFRMWSVL